ncbi:helix-turn-helix domain-containing protein [Actinacidiphila guanduensis]|uniref:Transcriptional regulator, contains XRE-family HTH domain n=1 Tax=Actinacidiphila guanduensis TaxID=310781 RepID=A0A1G9XY96_9ACTN|nr:helix-turn-helix transcriptional regulator [Actinacidiphila guanduensis]SDN01243.1 Transcriptional regulator, contains XRE-family HTH domain [Actinacidiphila guanduensis]
MDREPNTELRDFLRSRRARISPEQAGLPPHPGVRRVPGLRREEVALLAGVSVDYYVRLERGRHLNVSASVLDALARALRLTDLERAHLFRVARPTRTRSRPLPPQRVRPGLRLLLDSLDDVPAMVYGRRLDVLAANALARAVYTDFDALPVRDRNMARLVFLDPAVGALYADWEDAARNIVASLRLYAGQHPHDPALAELVGELSVQSQDFRRWWADHDVFQRTHGTKHLHHPLVGDLVLGYEAFTPADDPEQTLGVSTAEPGSPTAERLKLLAGWTATPPREEPQPGVRG